MDYVVAKCTRCGGKTVPHAFRLPRIQFCGDLMCLLTTCIDCAVTYRMYKGRMESWSMERMPPQFTYYQSDPPRPKNRRRGPLFGSP